MLRARATHTIDREAHPKIATPTRRKPRSPTRPHAPPLGSPALQATLPRRLEPNLASAPPMSAELEFLSSPSRSVAGRDVERTPARRRAACARNEPGGAAQRWSASGVGRGAWGCARFARKPPTRLANEKTDCTPRHTFATQNERKSPKLVPSVNRHPAPPRALEAVPCGTEAHGGSGERAPRVSPAGGHASARTSRFAMPTERRARRRAHRRLHRHTPAARRAPRAPRAPPCPSQAPTPSAATPPSPNTRSLAGPTTPPPARARAPPKAHPPTAHLRCAERAQVPQVGAERRAPLSAPARPGGGPLRHRGARRVG